MYNSLIHGVVTRDSYVERRENPAKQASSMLREPGYIPSFTRPPSPKPSSQGFLLSGPHTCGTSVVCADQPLTRASQRGHGGLRIEPGGGSNRLKLFSRSRCFKSVQRDATAWLREAYESESCFTTVWLRFAQTSTKKQS